MIYDLLIYDLLHFTGQDFTAAQRERAQEDFKVLFKGAPPHPLPPFAYERQPQHRDHPTNEDLNGSGS